MNLARTSELFERLRHQPRLEIAVTEVRSSSFARLRSAVRRLSIALREAEGPEVPLSTQLARLACSWLTLPVSFASIPQELRSVLPPSSLAQATWGLELARMHAEALAAAEEVATSENPLIAALQVRWRDLKASDKAIRVYCHRKATPAFLAALGAEPPVTHADFIHSLSSYRKSELFDVLVKVGPLRTFGWGSAPDAILTAPRYQTLQMLFWEGCANEPGFGYDPIAAAAPAPPEPSVDNPSSQRGASSWRTSVTVVGTREPSQAFETSDDLADYHRTTLIEVSRAAILIHTDNRAILYPRGASLLTYDPARAGDDAIRYRKVDDLHKGIFLIDPTISDLDLGATRADQGKFSAIWKGELSRMNAEDRIGLFFKLSDAGIDLENLAAAIDYWCRPPTTVIHAPKSKKHFRALIGVLGLQTPAGNTLKKSGDTPFWRSAWNEIGHSRSHAIQDGVEENEFLEGELRVILLKQIDRLASQSVLGVTFETPIPSETGIRGHFTLRRIDAVEEGFRAPVSAMRELLEVKAFESWRE